MNVSIVSVSRRAAPPHFGHFTFTNSGTLASGDSPSPGKFRHRRTAPRANPCRARAPCRTSRSTDGNRRAPVALPRNAPILQPENNFAFAESARLGVGGHFFDRFVRSESRVRSRIHELAVFDERRGRAFPASAAFLRSAASRSGSPIRYLVANSKSRSSCAGTHITAPVPYSISTKFPTQIGIFSPLNGLRAYRPVKNPSFSAVAMSAARVSRRRNLCNFSSIAAWPSHARDQRGQQRMLRREDQPPTRHKSCRRAS